MKKKKEKKERKHGEEQGREPDKTKDSKITSKNGKVWGLLTLKDCFGKEKNGMPSGLGLHRGYPNDLLRLWDRTRQVKSCHVKSSRLKLSHVMSCQFNSIQTKSNQIKSNQVK